MIDRTSEPVKTWHHVEYTLPRAEKKEQEATKQPFCEQNTHADEGWGRYTERFELNTDAWIDRQAAKWTDRI